mmetsp:Transcript_54805/g.81371  ORF Transcript_54805/g.81371 Transcript_54805/m.81371 type:complete len:373 (-) Transcript_54805:32-1150(-)
MAPNISSVETGLHPENKPLSVNLDDSFEKSRDSTEKVSANLDTLSSNNAQSLRNLLLPWCGTVVWPLMLTVPLLLSSPYSFTSYDSTFPPSWYEYDHDTGDRPKPLGLFLGIFAVAVGQVFVLCYFYLHSHGYFGSVKTFLSEVSINKSENEEESRDVKQLTPPPVQVKGAPQYAFSEGLQTHLSQPEGFVLLTVYLSGTWMFRLMPACYYSFEGGIQWARVFACLILQDGIQYLMHRLEHGVSPAFYRMSHKPHHKFTNPRLFDAFNGSTADTIIMILIPLYSVALLVRCNVWTYMAFGSVYANWLTLIHSEYPFPWDKSFRKLGFGTPGDHHVHHKFFKYNYGHLFMWFDRVCRTYQNPEDHPRVFSPEV